MINFCFQYIFIQYKQFDYIYVYDFYGKLIKKIDENFSLDIETVKGKKYLANRSTYSFWCIDEELNLIDISKYVLFNLVFKDSLIFDLPDNITCYSDLDGTVKWQIDITQYGRNRGIDPENGDILWDNQNEISDELFTDNRNIYIPLKGGAIIGFRY